LIRQNIEYCKKRALYFLYCAQWQKEHSNIEITNVDKYHYCGPHYLYFGHFDWQRTEGRVLRLLVWINKEEQKLLEESYED